MAGLLPLLDDRWMRHLHLETGRDRSVLYKEINISDFKKKKKFLHSVKLWAEMNSYEYKPMALRLGG